MKILVTGANGFVGGNLCRDLIEHGHQVRGLVRPTGDRRGIAGLAALEIQVGELSDPAALQRAARGMEVVVHAAARTSDWGPWKAFFEANVQGVANLIRAARAARIARLVHISSVSVYGFPGGVGLDEATPFTPRPGDPYVTSKAAGDRLALGANGAGLEVTVLRPGAVYGPGDRTTTARLAPLLQAGRFAWVDRGRYLMAPVYVGNLAELVRTAARHPAAPGRAFNAVDRDPVSWRSFIEWMCADLGCPPPRWSVPGRLAWPLAAGMETAGRVLGLKNPPPLTRYRVRAVMRHHHYAADKAARELGWQARVGTRQGVARAIDWYLGQAAAANPGPPGVHSPT